MKYSNNEIRIESDELLRKKMSKVFRSINCEVLPHDMNSQIDKGIDWIYEIQHREKRNTILKFNIQNKGSFSTKDFKLIKKKTHRYKGRISFQLKKIRHIPYYLREISEPVIITVCDLEHGF